LYISEFGGHRRAAENIKAAFKLKNPADEAFTVNGLTALYPRAEKVVDFVYTAIIKHLPHLWGRVYDRDGVIQGLAGAHRFVNRIAFDKMRGLLNDFKPDCIIATQAFPCGVVAAYKQEFSLDLPLIAVVTDYHPHRFWIHGKVDRYVVACEQARQVLIKEGVVPDKISILGIPISPKFMVIWDRKDVAKSMGLHQGPVSILLMGGGLGLGPLIKIARRLLSIDGDFQLIVVCGKNRRLYGWFHRNRKRFKKPVFYFGYVRFVSKLMDFSDIVITKGGGITVSEALAKGMGIIITNPIPGQEERNVKYLLENGAIVRADTVDQVVKSVSGLLADAGKLAALKKLAKALSAPDAAFKIVDAAKQHIATNPATNDK